MKRSYKKPRVKKVKIPKPVAPPKPKRPKRGDLKKIYKDLHTSDTDQRVNTLAKAMTWYDEVQAYLAYKQEGQFTTKQLRMKNNAERDRSLGIKSTISSTKERNFTDAITSYEVMVNGYQPPKLAPLLRKLKSKSGTLQEHKRNMQKKHGKFLQLIEDALGVKVGVDKLSTQYRISEKKVTLDRKTVINLRRLTRKYGLLSAVIQLLPILSEAMSQYSEEDNDGNKTGRYRIDYPIRYQAVLQLVHQLNMYGQRADAVRSIIRRHKHQTP